jgi:hypothetical protein
MKAAFKAAVKAARLVSLLTLCSILFTFVFPALTQAEEAYSYEEYREVVNLFFSTD